jgi:hypothetical protein
MFVPTLSANFNASDVGVSCYHHGSVRKCDGGRSGSAWRFRHCPEKSSTAGARNRLVAVTTKLVSGS